MSMLERVRFDMVFSFIYSPREGTRAAKMENQVSDADKKQRMARLLDVQCNISREKNDAYLGRVERVIVDDVERKDGVDIFSARTSTNKLVHFESDENHIGEFINVKITRTGAFDLFGEIERN